MNIEEIRVKSNPFSFSKSVVIVIFLLIFIQSWKDTEMSVVSLIDGWHYMMEYIAGNPEIENSGFFPPNLNSDDLMTYALSMLETIQMAIIALILSIIVAVPLSYMSSRNILNILIPGKSPIHEFTKSVSDNGSTVAGTDMSPVQPHTTGRKARTCESCHSNPKALGYGIQDGQFLQKQGEDLYMDLQDLKTGKFVPKNKTVQMKGIPGMDYDWSQIVTRDGKQLQTVGSHWPDSRPLDQDQRERMEKTGLCMGCHQNMSNKEIWDKLNTDKKLNLKEHIEKMHEMANKAAKAK